MLCSQQKDDKLERFEGLSLHHMNGLYSVALHLTRRSSDAEDLVQETYLRAFEHFDQFRPGTNFRAWIFRILRNAFVNHYHKNKLRIHVNLDSVEPTLGTRREDDALNARIDTSGDAFRAALSHLPHDYRIMLLLAYVEGFTYQEIAQVMGCPIGTVMSRLFRARRRLRDELQDKDRGSAPVGYRAAVAADRPSNRGTLCLQPPCSSPTPTLTERRLS